MLEFLATLERLERRIERALNPPKPKPKPKSLPARTSRSPEQARERAEKSDVEAPLFPEYYDDPVGFARDVLHVRLWSKQRTILRSIADHLKVAIRSGQKTGKTTAFIVAALWWACTRPRARVFLTAPGNKQVRNVLWKELRRIMYSRRKDGLRVHEVIGVEPAKLPWTGMQWPDGREIIGYAVDTPEDMQGFSGPEMLVLIDEGSGVEDPIFEAIDGNTAAGGHIATASQPTQQSGWFFDAFHGKSEAWDKHDLSSEETPNVTGDEEPIPGLAGPEKIAKWAKEYGRDSAFFIVRVLGQFAKAAANAVIGLDLVDAGKRRWNKRNDISTEAAKAGKPKEILWDPLELGVDCARFGDDDTCITPRRGYHVFGQTAKNGLNSYQIAEAVIQVVRTHRRPNEPRARVKIDATGGYGAGPADILRKDYRDEVAVYELNSSSKSDDEEKFVNLRSQMMFSVALWLKEGGELPPDTRLEADLLAPTYSFDPRGRKKVESKDDIKARLQRSPDRGDSLALCVYNPTGDEVVYDDSYDADLPAMRV